MYGLLKWDSDKQLPARVGDTGELGEIPGSGIYPGVGNGNLLYSFLKLIYFISFRMDWLDLLAVQRTLKSLLQHHSSKASILQCSAFFTVQLSHPFMTTGKIIALTRWTFVGKVTSLLFNMQSRLVIILLSEVSIFSFHGCNHHLQWFWSPPK